MLEKKSGQGKELAPDYLESLLLALLRCPTGGGGAPTIGLAPVLPALVVWLGS